MIYNQGIISVRKRGNYNEYIDSSASNIIDEFI